MQAPQLGVLRRVDIRLIWPSEARDFTSWLAQNLTLLGDVLGMDLELRLQEAPVGPFSLDLLAHDLGRDRTVIIENQLEPTDHDHLGKLLTYAAGHDATVAVWIAPNFRDEHRQALDWLNQRTDIATEFFGVVVEALQIDSSHPACNFRLVAFPNDWQKSNVATRNSKLSAREEAYEKFFQDLIDQLRTQHNFTKALKGQPQNWYTFSSGIRGIAYGVGFTLGNRVRTEAYIDRQNEVWNKWLFDTLFARRARIESEFGVPLAWERMDDKQASRIAIYRSGSISDPTSTLEEISRWAIEHLLQFKAIIGTQVSEIIASSDQPSSGDIAELAPET